MTNQEIIFQATCQFLGIDEATGGEMLLHGQFPHFHTYQAWKDFGFQVQKGEKAAFSAEIWKYVTRKDEDGKPYEKIIYKTAYFFGRSQVAPIQ